MRQAMTPTPRTSKPAAERRAEILDAAQRLFTSKGVQATSMADLLHEVGIAKGTLYYHFPSKDEIVRALVDRTTGQIISRAEAIAQGEGPALAKFLAVLGSARVEGADRELAEELQATGNSEFHVLSIVETVRRLTPVLVAVTEQGIAEGVFRTEHPREAIEVLLTSAGMLLDEGIFIGDEDEIPRRTAGIVHAAEVLLGCVPGALAVLASGSPEPGR